MATPAVELPASVIPERRQRTQPEVIDVDLLAEDAIQRPTQRRRTSDTVSVGSAYNAIVIDSDDEDIASHASSSTRPQSAARLFSPAPPIPDVSVPPVPAIPAHLRRRGRNVPMRPRSAPQPHRLSHAPSRATPPGLIRPNEQPFAFESALQAQPGPSVQRQPTPPPPAAAPSHHRPSMGFGGAILSFNRQAALEERIQRERAQERTMERLRRAMRFPTTVGARNILAQTFQRVSDRLQPYLFGGADEHYEADVLDAFALSDALSEDAALLRDDEDLFGDGDTILSRLRRLQPEFKSVYTHPQPAAPGFTHDFAPVPTKSTGPEVIVIDDDDPGPSTSAASSSSSSATNDVNMTLVCARCLDPLVLGVSGSEAEQSQRKLWALRCGHILDGKCMEALMKPPSDPTIDTDGVEINEEEERVYVKGKGKAKAVADHEDEPRMPGSFDVPTAAAAEAATSTSPQPSLEMNSIRSRLRPRNGSGHVESHSAASVAPSPPRPATRARPTTRPRNILATDAGRSPRSRARGKGKGKQKATQPRVEAEYEWHCPVPRCGHAHLSLKVEGKGWVMDDTRGAIGIFA